MINKVYIKYVINGFGEYEETILGGYKEGSFFYLGNNSKIKVLIEKVFDDKVILNFDDNDMKVLANNVTTRPEMKLKEEVYVVLPVTPSSTNKIQLIDIKKEQQLYYR